MIDDAKPRPVSSTDVAAHAGVSQATVSRVLSGKGQVSKATREKVERSLRELGYQPNSNARALRTQRTGTIAVAVADITNPFYPELVEALHDELSQAGQMMLLWDAATAGDDSSVVAAIQQGVVDGAIFATATRGSKTLKEASELRLPITLVNRALPALDFDSVTSDNDGGGRTVARYFLEAGRRPAVITGPVVASTSRERAQGFLAEWTKERPDADVEVRYTDFSHASGSAFCAEVMSSASPPDAIFAANDYTAFGVLDQAKRMGIGVPEDLWVVGYDDIAMAGWSAFDLTTVRQPTARMASEAVRLLLSRIADRSRASQSIRFSGEFIVRGSTA